MTVTAETLQWRLCLPFGLSLFLPQAAFVTPVILPARNLCALSTNLRHRTSKFYNPSEKFTKKLAWLYGRNL